MAVFLRCSGSPGGLDEANSILRVTSGALGLGAVGEGINAMKMATNRWIILGLAVSTLLAAGSVIANNLTLTNVTIKPRNDSTVYVQFDIRWDNSWRYTNINHDAAWVFLKYSSDGGATWCHATLQSSGTNPSGVNQGSGTGLDIVVPADKKGAFLQRSATGEGAVGTTGIQFVWDYGAALGADANGDRLAALATIRVEAIEVVYVPQGPFYLGDYFNSYNLVFFPTAQPRDSDQLQNIGPYGCQILVRSNSVHALKVKIYIPYQQSTGPFDDSDNGLVGLISYFDDSAGQPASCTGIWFNAGEGISIDQPTESNMNVNWPTGLMPFYYARYEVSQAQYRDFLNSLTPTQAVNRYIGSPNISGARFGIKNDNGLYGCDLNNNGIFDEADDGECVPATCCSANDSLALNDWAALRWVTEFEYEKAGRGPSTPVQYEAANAYGGAAVLPSSYTFFGMSTEVPANNTTDTGAWSLYNIRSLTGPLRSGALATSTSTRKKAMAGYYGNMDLSGNVLEDVISVGTIKGRSYTAVHGDGALTTDGYHNTTDWPGGPNISFEGGSDWKIPLADRAVAQRGGEWATMPNSITINGTQPIWLSSRYFGSLTAYHYNWRGTNVSGAWCYSHGLRGGRSGE